MIFNYDSTMPGALPLSGIAGALRNIHKTYLVDGAGAGPVATLTVAAGIATATYSGSHPFKVGVVGLFAGAAPAALNGLKTILSVTANSVTFAAASVADGPATGSITSKLAPAGWTELYPGTANVLALKPSASEATGMVVRVDDTGTFNARIRMYESMSDANTGIGLTPLDSQVSGGLFWPKSGASNATTRPWVLVADERGFYFASDPQGTGRYTLMFGGDFASIKSADAWAAVVAGNQSDQTNAVTVPDGCCGYSNRDTRQGAYIARSASGIGGSVGASRMGAAHNGTVSAVYSGGVGYSGATYPNGPNNGLLVTKLELWSLGLRGALPGLYHVRNAVGAEVGVGITVEGTDDLAGRKLLLLRVAPPSGSSTPGVVALDLTGPWAR